MSQGICKCYSEWKEDKIGLHCLSCDSDIIQGEVSHDRMKPGTWHIVGETEFFNDLNSLYDHIVQKGVHHTSTKIAMNTIRVVVLVLPDGTTVWMRDENSQDKISKVLDNWRNKLSKDRLKEFENAHCTSGAVVIYMLEEDFNNITSTNESYEIFTT